MTRVRNTPVYDNCVIEAPDGQPLCRTSFHKIEWYRSRSLGEIVRQEPLTLRLFFEPKGRAGAEHPYTTSHKLNVCVVCGTTENITRHHVVPRCFRRHFPPAAKDHALHDVLILCKECHDVYEYHAFELKKRIAASYGVPMNRKVQNNAGVSAKLAAFALLRHCDKIPMPRREELLDRVRAFYGKTDISHDDLISASNIDTADPSFRQFGALVVERLENIDVFVKQWRRHFCDTMSPEFLPDHWRVENNIY